MKLADLAGKPAVLYFYPRDNTSGCAMEAEGFRDAMPALSKLGAAVYGISKDSIASHCSFRDKYKLTFPLLTDETGATIEAYGAWGEKNLYGKKSMGIIRSTVLLDAEGKVVKHWPKVTVAGHAEAVTAAVQALVDGVDGVDGDEAAAPAKRKAAPAKPQVVAAKRPAAKPPASKQPASKQPASKQPASKQPASKQPTSKQPRAK